MREIKFRCWDKLKKEWYGESNENLLTFYGFSLFGECTYMLMPSVGYLQNLIIEQFAGLYDKNNNHGFEGDIILIKNGQIVSQSYDFPNDDPKEEFKDIVSQIKFISPSFCYFHPNVDEWVPIDCEFEIIGNIHQNKDLLK